MRRIENLTIKQIKKEVLAWEYNPREPKSIKVTDIYVDDDNEVFQNGYGHDSEMFYCTIVTNTAELHMGYEWDIINEEIVSAVKEKDQ